MSSQFNTPTQKLTVEQSFGVVPIYKSDKTEVKFLLIQHHAGHWAFPKGHADPGETELQTARRELREETGIDEVLLITSPTFEEHYTLNRRGQPREKVVRYWIGYVQTQKVTVQEEEVRDHTWATLDEARKLITYSQSKKLLEDVARHLSS
jgi:8-oxo-dGTP pyrophosphatase MutT (NUDIX family)